MTSTYIHTHIRTDIHNGIKYKTHEHIQHIINYIYNTHNTIATYITYTYKRKLSPTQKIFIQCVQKKQVILQCHQKVYSTT